MPATNILNSNRRHTSIYNDHRNAADSPATTRSVVLLAQT